MGSTDSELALALIQNTNFFTTSPTLLSLTSKLLISRAQKPKKQQTLSNLDGVIKTDDQFKYLREKVRILGSIGDTDSINKLVENIPLTLKNNSFRELLYELRQTDKDIPFVCNELNKKILILKKISEKENSYSLHNS